MDNSNSKMRLNKMKNTSLDEIDIQILDFLIKDARIPYTTIAKELILSAGTIHVRVKKMEEKGVINGSTISVNYAKIGYSLVTYVGIILEKSPKNKSVIDILKLMLNITSASVVNGVYNILCKIVTKDIQEIKNIVDVIDNISGVKKTETIIVFEEAINNQKGLMELFHKEQEF